MSNVESQISMALQGLLAGQRGTGGGGGGQQGPDPRMLQQLMQMEQDQAMGLDKERERMAKEGLRQEKQATLGVMLQDAMARQQAEEAFQRQIEMQNMMLEREKSLENQRNEHAIKQTSFILQNNSEAAAREAENVKRAVSEQKRLGAQLVAENYRLSRSETGIANGISAGLRPVMQIYRARAELNARVDGELTALNAAIMAHSPGRKGIGKALFGAGSQGGRDALRPVAQEYSNRLARAMLSADKSFDPMTGQRRAETLSHRIETFLLDAGDESMSPEGRIQRLQQNLQAVREETGDYGVAVLKRALSSLEQTAAAGFTNEQTGERTVSGFMETAQGRMFRAANSMLGTGLSDSAFDMPDPGEMMEGLTLAFTELLMSEDPKTGQPYDMEARQVETERLVRNMTKEFQQEFGLDEDKAGEVEGFLTAALIRMLPLDQQKASYDILVNDMQATAEGQAMLERLELDQLSMSRTKEYLNSLVQDAVAKGLMEGKGGSNATPGTGEAAEGLGAAVGTNPAES